MSTFVVLWKRGPFYKQTLNLNCESKFLNKNSPSFLSFAMSEALSNLKIKIAPALIKPTAATAPTQDALFIIFTIIKKKVIAKIYFFINKFYLRCYKPCLFGPISCGRRLCLCSRC
jgi:hypothetical protein